MDYRLSHTHANNVPELSEKKSQSLQDNFGRNCDRLFHRPDGFTVIETIQGHSFTFKSNN